MTGNLGVGHVSSFCYDLVAHFESEHKRRGAGWTGCKQGGSTACSGNPGDDEWVANFGGLLLGRGEENGEPAPLSQEEPVPLLHEEPAPTITNG